MSSLRRTRIGLQLLVVLFLPGTPSCCLLAKDGQTAGQNNPQITVSKYDYTLIERRLNPNGKIVESTYRRTEYFASDGRERIEDITSLGNMRPVKLLLPKTQTLVVLDFGRKTYTETHQQVGPISGVVMNPPINQWTTSPLGTMRIAGLDCNGNSATKDGAYNEIWRCKGAPSDFAVTIDRAADGTGVEQRLKEFNPAVQVAADSFNIPPNFRRLGPH